MGKLNYIINQVFVATYQRSDPRVFIGVKGCIDCPDLPLNVSRSFLQNDGFASKVSNYITKKVADKLNGLFKRAEGL